MISNTVSYSASANGVYLNKREVAARLNKSPRTVNAWMRQGLIPYFKIGRSVAFRWADVEEHLRENFRVCRTEPKA